ncbi:hypothetical protein EDB80DRAFT_715842 [Ilyonectria destructans]|nr:hypothetical protein EDB80DRAFT_715842 [Ilyonectria destructans]
MSCVRGDVSFVCFLLLIPFLRAVVIALSCHHPHTRHGCSSPGPGTFRDPPTTRTGTIPSRLPAIVNPHPLYAGPRVGNKIETRARHGRSRGGHMPTVYGVRQLAREDAVRDGTGGLTKIVQCHPCFENVVTL